MDDCEPNNAIDSLKKRAAAYLSDLYNATSTSSSSSSVSSCSSFSTPASPLSVMEEDIVDEVPAKKSSGKKRSYSQYTGNAAPSALDLLTQSAAKKLALASGDLPTPMMSDEDFLAQAGALLASANNSMYMHFLFIM